MAVLCSDLTRRDVRLWPMYDMLAEVRWGHTVDVATQIAMASTSARGRVSEPFFAESGELSS